LKVIRYFTTFVFHYYHNLIQKMRIKLLLLLLCIPFISTEAQKFRGLVIDNNGKPIPYASLYIKELKSGVMTDAYGSFFMYLPAGDYSCETSCPGYDSTDWKLHQTKTTVIKNIVLQRRRYALPKENDENENPAISIIQSAIQAAPHYLNIISGYKADVYTKNREKLLKVPGIQKMSKTVRYLAKNYQGKLVVSEEHKKINYRSPNIYQIRTLNKTTVLPKELDIPIDISTTNIYDRMILNKLSPIAPEAMRYYRYILICTTKESGHTIYKIQVIPKHLQSVLVSGYIYIVDKLWCVSAFDLLTYDSHIIANIKVAYKEIVPSGFLPITIQAGINYHNTGFQALSYNIHSIRYDSVTVNSKAQPLQNKYRATKEHRFERLLPKDLISIKEDTMALNRDSTKWDSIRCVPLLPEEAESYQLIKPEQKKKTFHFSMKDWTDMRTWWNLIVKGDRFMTPNKKQWMDCYNIQSTIPEYNFVDGLWIGYKLGLGWRISHANTFEFNPATYYTTARHKWIAFGDFSFTYAPRARGRISLKGGSLTQDYNEESGESRLFNSVSALIYADNYVKLFNKQYIAISNQVEPFNGMLFSSSLSWERRRKIDNHVHHSLLGQDAESNSPFKDDSYTMPANRLLKMSLALEYTPNHYYCMKNDQKIYEETENPTLSLSYTQAFSIGKVESSPHYSKIQAGIKQTINVGLFNHFIWLADAGCFFNRKSMEFPDYHHFPTVKNTSTTRSFSYGFFLPNCYTFSTPDRWVMVNATWNTPYLLIKYLPIFQHKKFDEAIHFRLLATPEEHPYMELSYSTGVEDISRVGFCIGFDRTGYRSVGISLSFAM